MSNVYENIYKLNERYSLYNIRKEEYRKSGLPFRVSPNTFKLNSLQAEELKRSGNLICMYMLLVMNLYKTDAVVKEILDRGKKNFLDCKCPHYLFLRPDFIIDKSGNFKLCEIETSIFGLALADALNKSYLASGIETLVQAETLEKYILANVPQNGTIFYSNKVKAFQGQLKYLAENIFNWNLKEITENEVITQNVYRAFYLSEYKIDKGVERLVTEPVNFIPSLTPQFEEKAVMAFLWDKRYTKYFEKNLGKQEYLDLRKLIPPTWIIGEEEHLELGLPNGISNVMEIANLPKSKRKLVLKKSGDSSWGEGVLFLHKTSHNRIEMAIKNALASDELYIMQEFNEAKKIDMFYMDMGEELKKMEAKVRITPYYAFSSDEVGKIIAVKVTGCENTDYIHGASNSINTSVS